MEKSLSKLDYCSIPFIHLAILACHPLTTHRKNPNLLKSRICAKRLLFLVMSLLLLEKPLLFAMSLLLAKRPFPFAMSLLLLEKPLPFVMSLLLAKRLPFLAMSLLHIKEPLPTQCTFCLGLEGLLIEQHFKSFYSNGDLKRNFQRKHLWHHFKGQPIECSHSKYKISLQKTMHLQSHAELVHKT